MPEETLAFANQLTGEPLDPRNGMTELSGGQARALLIADAVIIGNSPIILLDEIENEGITRSRDPRAHRRADDRLTETPRITARVYPLGGIFHLQLK